MCKRARRAGEARHTHGRAVEGCRFPGRLTSDRRSFGHGIVACGPRRCAQKGIAARGTARRVCHERWPRRILTARGVTAATGAGDGACHRTDAIDFGADPEHMADEVMPNSLPQTLSTRLVFDGEMVR
jgi:hypothetical protein